MELKEFIKELSKDIDERKGMKASISIGLDKNRNVVPFPEAVCTLGFGIVVNNKK